ncbi:MAG TPA: FAD-binding oxidoreductase [Rubrobacter sp.]|jgi:FAD/FMN-containing dehydrogenase|nr:FAD-binding oxidoreductase [Rubrobacter sp.]
MSVTTMSPDWDALQSAIAGEVVLPESPGYDAARKPTIARFHDARPQAIVLCETAEDVSGAILFARRSGLETASRSGGHCFAGRSSTGGVVLDVSPMRSVSVSGGVATVGAGARLGGVYDALDGHGLTIPAGCGPDVGIAGLTLGGGLGILGRKYGLTSDSLLAAQVALANGRIVECDEHNEPDLFWALRGAGGCNFGVLTSLVFSTLPAPDATAFHLIWPDTFASAVMEAWQGWSPAGPDELAASLLLTASGDPEEPPGINVFGAMIGTESDSEGLLEDLVARVGADPASASLEHASYRETKRYLAEHGPGDDRPDGHQFSKSEFFRRPLPREAVEALVRNFSEGRVASQSRELDFTPWGGAYNRVPAVATAFTHRGELFLLKHAVTVEPDAEAVEKEAALRWLGRSWATGRPWGTGRAYPNFPDPDLEDWPRAYHGTNLERLARVKEKYDPDNLFRFHQSVPSYGASTA